MTEPRFYVIGVWGHSQGVNGRPPSVSYSVLDSCYMHREVYRRYVKRNGRHDRLRRRECETVAAALNQVDADEQAGG